MLDELWEAATYFDWISPTLAMAQDVANGPSHTFLIPVQCGWTGREISNGLRDHGIKTWGHMIVNGHFMITVRDDDAGLAHRLMEQAGLPVGDSPVGRSGSSAPRSAQRNSSKRGRQKKSQRRGSILDDLADLLLR